MREIITQLSDYINSLDWAYIFTFILICYGCNSEYITGLFYKIFRFKIATRYRVLLIGVLYGITVYFIRDYSIGDVEVLLQSFVFALVFHKLLIQKVIRYFFQIKQPKPTKYEN
ncbi:hypothetical protein U8527_10535 [Kordia algicida OT-1]|uniref:Uncharacterized protein n=1 Tax=Kordia algicida OT-1 TaxID=391587 RepID=A9DWD1_9FLAO|nr:hypothetical protein [Kordia algicida]EDP96543.1 hypothetical protein KAOT1_04002 [Kordia algicida OT-1]